MTMDDNKTTSSGKRAGIDFKLPKTDSPSIIKVIGVGGGGGNAVNHMYNEGIHDVTYLLCNTDRKALEDSPVPTTLQLGDEGLGAGNKPEVACQAALDSIESINTMLDDGTKMVFITAGMGGGTGTGAAPIIAKCAREKGILTVGIVTIPFAFEGKKKIYQALEGVNNIKQHVDALLVINNERLRQIYPELTVINAFARADDTLTVAARSISEIITMRGRINLDFRDVKTVLENGGVALMSTGYGEGENRVTKAIEEAIKSPLLNNNDIFNSKKVLLNINFSDADQGQEFTMEEMNEVHNFMSEFSEDVETKLGMAIDPSLGSRIKITLLATGFGLQNVPGMKEKMEEQKREKTEAEQELEEQLARLRGIYYEDGKQSTTLRKRQIFIFAPDELDNEDLIARVESTPTYRRTKDELAQIRNTASGRLVPEPEQSEGAQPEHPADNLPPADLSGMPFEGFQLQPS